MIDRCHKKQLIQHHCQHHQPIEVGSEVEMDAEEAAIEDEELADRLPIIKVVIILGIHIRKTLLIKWMAYNQNLAIYANLLITLQPSVQTYRSFEKCLIAQINQPI